MKYSKIYPRNTSVFDHKCVSFGENSRITVHCMTVCHILIYILFNYWSVIIRVNEMFKLLIRNIEKFWHYFVEISLINWLWYDIHHHLLVDGNFGIFFGNIVDILLFIDIFIDFSRNITVCAYNLVHAPAHNPFSNKPARPPCIIIYFGIRDRPKGLGSIHGYNWTKMLFNNICSI